MCPPSPEIRTKARLTGRKGRERKIDPRRNVFRRFICPRGALNHFSSGATAARSTARGQSRRGAFTRARLRMQARGVEGARKRSATKILPEGWSESDARPREARPLIGDRQSVGRQLARHTDVSSRLRLDSARCLRPPSRVTSSRLSCHFRHCVTDIGRAFGIIKLAAAPKITNIVPLVNIEDERKLIVQS